MVQWTLFLLGGTAAVAAVAGAVLLIWRGPWWIDGEYLSTKELRSGSAALVTGFRTAVVQLLAIFGASVALLFTAFNYRLTRRGQVTERFTKALERLGSGELYVRIGGLLALEQIVHDAPDQAPHTAQVLNTFVRQRAPQRPDAPATNRARIVTARRAALNGRTPATPMLLALQLEEDVQLALTALTGSRLREASSPGPNLNGLHLSGANLAGANLAQADLTMADLSQAELGQAQLSDANLFGANLANANLSGALLAEGELSEADLTRANLYRAKLAHSTLVRANLTDSSFNEADLTKAQLRRCPTW